MRVAWLTSYAVSSLPPQVRFIRRQLSHACSWIVSLANELSTRRELELHVVTAAAGILENQYVTRNGVTFHVIRHTFPFTMRGFPDYMRMDALTYYDSLRKQIRLVLDKVQPDLVHVHGTEYGYGLAALDSGVPTVVSMQGIINRIREVEDTMFYRLQAPMERDVVRRGRYFGTRTKWANEFVRSLNPNATIYDMPEAVNPMFFEDRQRTRNSNLLFVGSVERRKGIEVAIDAMRFVVRQHPTARLRIVGGGKRSYLDTLKQLVQANNLEHAIEWKGSKAHEEIAALHSDSLVLIHPTFIDNSPNSVAEAMVSGLPVIASNVGGIPSMIEDGVTGILVPPQEPERLAEAIVKLLKDDADRERLRVNAQAIARTRHLPRAVAGQTLEVYKDILKRERKLSW